MARHDPGSQTISFILDTAIANAAIHALSVHAADREAHAREVQQHAQALPENSYGRTNRQAMAARKTRITTRLRAIERAYQTAIDPNVTAALKPPEITATTDRAPDRELELE